MRAGRRKNEMLIIRSKRAGTYTMAELTEALGGENSMSKPSQQLLNTLRRCLIASLAFKHKLVKGSAQSTLSRESQSLDYSHREPLWTKQIIKIFTTDRTHHLTQELQYRKMWT